MSEQNKSTIAVIRTCAAPHGALPKEPYEPYLRTIQFDLVRPQLIDDIRGRVMAPYWHSIDYRRSPQPDYNPIWDTGSIRAMSIIDNTVLITYAGKIPYHLLPDFKLDYIYACRMDKQGNYYMNEDGIAVSYGWTRWRDI